MTIHIRPKFIVILEVRVAPFLFITYCLYLYVFMQISFHCVVHDPPRRNSDTAVPNEFGQNPTAAQREAAKLA